MGIQVFPDYANSMSVYVISTSLFWVTLLCAGFALASFICLLPSTWVLEAATSSYLFAHLHYPFLD